MASEKPIKIAVKLLSSDAMLPSRMSENAAGFDIRAFLSDTVVIKTGERALIPTGFSIGLPHGYEAQIRPRSGLAIRHGITCLNSPGTIDEDYRGEVKVILANLGENDFEVKNGDRIAQMVVQKIPNVELIEKDSLSDTGRSDGGFGSTGLE